jgi:uncharacterized protein
MSLGSFVSGYVPMLRLGDFNFSLNVAVFQEMRRVTEYQWASQDRFGQLKARQFVSLGDDTLTLPGIIYPEWRGSSNAMAQLRTMGAQGLPYLMLDAQGHIYGRWTIESVEENRGIFAAFTQPKKIEFTVTLKLFDGGDNGLLPDLSGTMLGSIISGASGLLQSI